MTKWKCDRAGAICFKPCYAEREGEDCAPDKCLFSEFRTPKWERVPDESEQKSETTLPDWCKVGEWVYSIPAQKYDKIIAIQDFRIVTREMKYTECYINDGNVVQARFRPWTFEEAPAVLKVKDPHGLALAYLSPFGGKYIIAYHHPDEYEKIKLGEVTFTFSAFADIFTQVDGKPCGKFEHLEDGEWVE